MEHIPIQLFDYATLARLATLNHAFYGRAKREMAMRSRAKGLLGYLLDCTPETKQHLLTNRFDLEDVWAMFTWIQEVLLGKGHRRYVYVPCPYQNSMNLCIHATYTHPFGVIMHTCGHMHVPDLVRIFGTGMISENITDSVVYTWALLHSLARGLQHVLCQDIRVSWTTSTYVYMCKVDLVNKKVFLTDPMVMTSDGPNTDTSFFCPTTSDNDAIRYIVLSMM